MTVPAGPPVTLQEAYNEFAQTLFDAHGIVNIPLPNLPIIFNLLTEEDYAAGYFQFSANPTDGVEMPAINGYEGIIFKDVPADFPEIQIGATRDETLGNLENALNNASGLGNYPDTLDPISFTHNAFRLLLGSREPGEAGNLITLGEEKPSITRSGTTLSGGVDGGSEPFAGSPQKIVQSGIVAHLEAANTPPTLATDLFAGRKAAVPGIFRVTCPAAGIEGSVFKIGGMILTVGDDVAAGADEIEFAANLKTAIDLQLGNGPFTSATDNEDGTLDVEISTDNFTAGHANVLETYAENDTATFTVTQFAVDAYPIAQTADVFVAAAMARLAAAGFDFSTAELVIDTDDPETPSPYILTAASKRSLRFTGNTALTVQLPVAATMGYIGSGFWGKSNLTSALISFESSGGDPVQDLVPGSKAWIGALILGGTDEASWDPDYVDPNEYLTTGDSLLSSIDVDTDVGTKQALYTVPADKRCIVTKAVVRDASATLAAMGDLLQFGFNAAADDWQLQIAGARLATLTGPTLNTVAAPSVDNTNVTGAAAAVFGCVFTDPSITATVTIDVFGYLVPA